MTQTALVQTSAPDAAPPQLCDRPGCTAHATFTYTWEWGETGVCCSKHQVELGQLQKPLKRSCQFSPLNPGATPALTRDERAKLKAEVYVLQEELAEAKGRGLQMYEQTQALAKQVQLLSVQKREQDAQLKDARDELQMAMEELDARKAELGEIIDEVGRLRTLVPFTPPADEGTQPGVSD